MEEDVMKAINITAAAILSAAVVLCSDLSAEQFTEKELALWKTEYMSAVKEGRALFTGPQLGKNRAACMQCHPNAANTNPETYPKYRKQLGKVATIGEMVNWCIVNALEGDRLGLDSRKMVSLISYITYERRGTTLAPGTR